MSSKDDAKEAVVGISKKYGFVGDDIMDLVGQWNPNIRRIIEEGMLAKDRLAAHSIKTLAKNIYGSDARFVFELLQNADDNRFTRAKASGSLPFISFQVHPRRIVVECNEDGFSKDDLVAISAVGESNKLGSYGYIGAKGIGFKSVFIAAWKVYIQSGHFSFYFKHEKGDLGLGMVLPVWQDTDEELHGPLTRMTLYLHEKGDPKELEHLRDTIFKQLGDLQQTCLLFLKNLKQIRVAFYDESGGLASSKDFRVGDVDNHSAFLETVSTSKGGGETKEQKYYHVTRHTATDLAKSDNRERPNTDKAGKTSSTAEIVLAFPLTSDSQPIIEQQELFAFLPVRESNFKASYFLIHSDFDTSASRQDILTTSRRNISLLDGIAAAFVKAVLQFCEHQTLCYTWPSFLPPTDDDSSDFWSALIQKIKRLLCETPVLRSRHRKDLRKIKDVVILADIAMDKWRNPLFDDEASDPFLSGKYTRAAQNPLAQYGLEVVNFDLLLDMVYTDLSSRESRMKSNSTSQDWHSAVAKLFSDCFDRNLQGTTSRLRRLHLLPLRNGQWVSAKSDPVYFPTTKGIPIPLGVDIRLLDPTAVANADRKTLFCHLGAVEPPIAKVRASMLETYESSSHHINMTESKAHLHYLYLTHQPTQARGELKGIYVHSHDGRVGNPHQEDFYLPGGHCYGPEALLEPKNDAPGLQVSFVHPTYLEGAPDPPSRDHPSWGMWLYNFVRVRKRLRLVSRCGDSLSDTFTYVAEHRPEKLLGLLKFLWDYEGSHVSKNAALKTKIGQLRADTLCGRPELTGIYALKDTFLPLPRLKEQRLRFMEESEHFPFLKLETASAEQLNKKWMFLHTTFLVGADDNVQFLLKILYWIQRANPEPSSVSRFQKLLDLYPVIYAGFLGAEDQQAEGNSIRRFFDTYDCIYIPAYNGSDAEWANPADCLWDAPPDIVLKYPLKHLYGKVLGTPQMERISCFFQQALSIPGASWDDLTRELEDLRDSNCEDFDSILELYKYLNSMEINTSDDKLSQEFEKKSLIFAERNGRLGWYKTSECLWSSTTEIRGKVTLNDHYEDLKDFFIKTLGVKTLNLQMVYDELLKTNSQTTLNELKNTIWSFNALLQTEPKHPEPEPLLKASIFPVTYPNGVTSLRSVDIEFAIVDRKYLATRFEGRIKLLDYTLEQVWHLKPFFEWANLQHRYLSASVKEITSVSDGTRRPISVLNRDLKRKADALLRIAATFNSPRYQADAPGLYRLLRTAEVIEANGISSALMISQDGEWVKVEVATHEVHISESPSGLKIYVPMNETSQDLCFAALLPTNLADWLMRDPTTQIPAKVANSVVIVLTAILSVGLPAVNAVLDRQGIIQVQIPMEDAEVDNDRSRTTDLAGDDAASSQRSVTPSQRSVTPSSIGDMSRATGTPETPTTDTDQEDASIFGEQAIARQALMSYRSAEIRLGPVVPLRERLSTEDIQYRALLNRVVAAARRAAFPTQGVFDMTDLLNALPGDDIAGFDGLDAVNRFRSSSQLERDKKIGAAGELYMEYQVEVVNIHVVMNM